MSIIPIKQLVSVCAQFDKKEVMTECFAMTGWDVRPTELKAIAEFQYIYGINMMCMHLLPYSEVGYRKNDHPAHFSKTNAWAEEVLPSFNIYFDNLGKLIRSSHEEVDVAVLHPMRSMYLTFKHEIFDEKDKALIEFSNSLSEKVAYHYIDETLLESYGKVCGNKIVCGSCEYSVLIIPPKILTISKNTDKLIRDFINNGGKIYVCDEPKYLDGESYKFDYFKSNITMQEIEKTSPYSLAVSGGIVRSSLRKNKKYSIILT